MPLPCEVNTSNEVVVLPARRAAAGVLFSKIISPSVIIGLAKPAGIACHVGSALAPFEVKTLPEVAIPVLADCSAVVLPVPPTTGAYAVKEVAPVPPLATSIEPAPSLIAVMICGPADVAIAVEPCVPVTSPDKLPVKLAALPGMLLVQDIVPLARDESTCPSEVGAAAGKI